jgi:uncharacterized protein
MVIDDHIHVHEWSFKEGDRDFEVDFVVEQMDEWGVDLAVIMDSLAYIGLDQNASNDHTRAAVDAYPDRLVGFANLKPPQGIEACREEMARTIGGWGFRGIKLHPQVDRYPLNDRRLVYPVIEEAIRHDVPVWVHTGHAPNATPTLMGTIARDYPEAKLIIGHMGSGMFYDAMWVARKYANVYLDISLQGGHAFGAACEEVGAGKLLFGSDAPYASPGSMKRVVEESSLSSADKGRVLGSNIAKLIKVEIKEPA